MTGSPLATKTPRLVSNAGAESACVSRATNSDPLLAAVVADGLADRQDVGFVEAAVERRAAMPGRAERDQLVGVTGVGRPVVVGADQRVDVHEHVFGRRLSGAVISAHLCAPGWTGTVRPIRLWLS